MAGACRGPRLREAGAPTGAGLVHTKRSAPARSAAKGGLGTWAPLCVAAREAGRGAGQHRPLPSPAPSTPTRAGLPPRPPGGAGQSCGRRRPAAGARGLGTACSADTRTLVSVRLGLAGGRLQGRPAWEQGPAGRENLAVQEFSLPLEKPASGSFPKLRSSKWGFCLVFPFHFQKNLYLGK